MISRERTPHTFVGPMSDAAAACPSRDAKSPSIGCVTVAHVRSSAATRPPGAVVFNVTSRSGEPRLTRFSPMFPHGDMSFSPFFPGGITVPVAPDVSSASVEGLWQGLKIFKDTYDASKLSITTMKGIKKAGIPKGHYGGPGKPLLDYAAARKLIYVPAYTAVLDKQEAAGEMEEFVLLVLSGQTVVLLDFDTNGDVENLSKPLSHASLLAARIMAIAMKRSVMYSQGMRLGSGQTLFSVGTGTALIVSISA